MTANPYPQGTIGNGRSGPRPTPNDTGWLDVTATLTFGWTATSVLVRRFGDVVEWRFINLSGAASTNDDLIAPVSGFRSGTPAGNDRATGQLINSAADPASTQYGIGIYGSGGVSIRANQLITAGYGSFTYLTADPWPTDLPGQPI